MAEQADARDLKSLGVTAVPVQVRSSAPKNPTKNNLSGFYCFYFLLSIFKFNLIYFAIIIYNIFIWEVILFFLFAFEQFVRYSFEPIINFNRIFER